MLKINDLSLNIDKTNILNNINLELEKEKTYVITGANGSGKSSLAKVIMGIYQIEDGEILFDNKVINELNISERAKLGINFSFQHLPHFKGITVNRLLDIAGASDNKGEVLKKLGLCPCKYLNREINDTLSGGELKRIELASVLVKEPKLLILDEPEAGIDLWSFDGLIETLKYLITKKELTLVIITHHQKIIELADQLIVMGAGEITEQIEKSKIKTNFKEGCNLKSDVFCGEGTC